MDTDNLNENCWLNSILSTDVNNNLVFSNPVGAGSDSGITRSISNEDLRALDVEIPEEYLNQYLQSEYACPQYPCDSELSGNYNLWSSENASTLSDLNSNEQYLEEFLVKDSTHSLEQISDILSFHFNMVDKSSYETVPTEDLLSKAYNNPCYALRDQSSKNPKLSYNDSKILIPIVDVLSDENNKAIDVPNIAFNAFQVESIRNHELNKHTSKHLSSIEDCLTYEINCHVDVQNKGCDKSNRIFSENIPKNTHCCNKFPKMANPSAGINNLLEVQKSPGYLQDLDRNNLNSFPNVSCDIEVSNAGYLLANPLNEIDNFIEGQESPGSLQNFGISNLNCFPNVSSEIEDSNAGWIVSDNPNRKVKTGLTKKTTRRRTKFSEQQLQALNCVFSKKQYLTREETEQLTKSFEITESALKNWFANQRQLFKRKSAASSKTTKYHQTNESFHNESRYSMCENHVGIEANNLYGNCGSFEMNNLTDVKNCRYENLNYNFNENNIYSVNDTRPNEIRLVNNYFNNWWGKNFSPMVSYA